MSELNDEQQEVFRRAIELLKFYDHEEVPNVIYYFRDKDENELADSEFDCCPNCVEKAEKKLRKEHGLKGKWIYPTMSYNDSDHDYIGSCCICFCPLNESLTWIESEFNHHRKDNTTRDMITESRNAFDIRVMFESMPTIDRDYDDAAQSEFYQEVVEYAKLVINQLTPKS